jgi:2,5-furandicarboxylate decarboxylase 1
MPKDLRTFIAELENARPGDLIRVSKEVDPHFEASGVAAKLEQQGRLPALLFENVKGADFPALTNLCATFERLALSLGTNVREMVEVFADRERQGIPGVIVDDTPVKDVVLSGDQADLSRIPILTHNELDGGPYISGAVMLTRDPDSGETNAGIYRHQVHDAKTLGVAMGTGHHAHYIWRRYTEMSQDMPVALVVGHHPAFLMGAVSRLPQIGGELEVAGSLLGEPVGLTKAEDSDLLVPARAEIIIEGYIPPNETHYEGPFGEWPRYYALQGPQPIIRVTSITHRRDAIYQDVFAAHAEHNTLGALPRMGSLYRRVKGVVPSITGLNLPMSGGGRAHCYISYRKGTEGEGKSAAFQVLAAEPDVKLIILVDEDIDVFNESEVLWALATRFEGDRDMNVIHNALGMILIPTAYDRVRDKHGWMNTKIIMDATKPLPPAEFPPRAQVPADLLASIDLAEYLPLTTTEKR